MNSSIQNLTDAYLSKPEVKDGKIVKRYDQESCIVGLIKEYTADIVCAKPREKINFLSHVHPYIAELNLREWRPYYSGRIVIPDNIIQISDLFCNSGNVQSIISELRRHPHLCVQLTGLHIEYMTDDMDIRSLLMPFVNLVHITMDPGNPFVYKNLRCINEYIVHIAENYPMLQSIDLCYNKNITPLTWCTLATSCKHLRTIEFDDTNLNDESLMAFVTNCPHLEHVDCGGTAVTQASIEKLVKTCPIKELYVENSLLLDKSLNFLVDSAPLLEVLMIDKHSVSSEAKQLLIARGLRDLSFW